MDADRQGTDADRSGTPDQSATGPGEADHSPRETETDPPEPGSDPPLGKFDSTEMESLHPRIQVVWIAKVLIYTILLGTGLVFGGQQFGFPWLPAIAVVLAILGVVHAVARYRVWRFQLQEDALYLERGVITQVFTSAPYVRIQHVDTRRGPIDRALGLSRVVVYTAGSRGADVSIPGLQPKRAEALREQLRELAGASDFEDAT